ncbi:MAG: T9SS type A sorting domain-containing protein [Bacteroidetes bacterium]|nr:T9SS type A sorting domain-containing protein [Bacteroidota bacterium]
MKSKLIILLLLLCGVLNAQSFQFGKKGGGASTDYGYGMCVDNSGNIYTAGCYKSNASFENVNVTSLGDFDIFIAKYNSAGSLLWFKSAGSSMKDEADKIFIGEDGNVYVGGTFQGVSHFDGITLTAGGVELGEDIFIAKLNPAGEYQWVKQYGGASQDFIVDMSMINNDVFITGQYYGTFTAEGGISLPPNGSSTAKFVMRVGADGTPVWAKNTGGYPYIATGTDKFYMAGIFGGTSNFDGVMLTSNGPADLFLGAYDLNGTQLWVKQFGGSGSENMRSLCFDRASNNIYWAGCFQNSMTMGSNNLTSTGQYDIFVSKFDVNGNNIWVKSAGGANYDFANATVVDAQGSVFVSGYCMETATFGNTNVVSSGQGDAYIAKYNSNGDFQWVKIGGGSGQDVGNCLRTDNAGNIFLTGFFSNSAVFGSINMTGYGSADYMLIKMGDLVGIHSPRETLSSFRLNQNYPNPFNPSTKISFDIVKAGAVKLTVSDINGKEVAELVNVSMNTGSYEVNFNAEKLSGGIYFYKLETANGTDTKKMILVK